VLAPNDASTSYLAQPSEAHGLRQEGLRPLSFLQQQERRGCLQTDLKRGAPGLGTQAIDIREREGPTTSTSRRGDGSASCV